MPSIRASQNIQLEGWKMDSAPVEEPKLKNSAPSPNTRPPFMLASMPLSAATNDALAQFYNGTYLPSFRTVPFIKGGGVL